MWQSGLDQCRAEQARAEHSHNGSPGKFEVGKSRDRSQFQSAVGALFGKAPNSSDQRLLQ